MLDLIDPKCPHCSHGLYELKTEDVGGFDAVFVECDQCGDVTDGN